MTPSLPQLIFALGKAINSYSKMSDPYISWQSPIFDDNGAPSSFSASLMTLRLIERHLPAAQQMAPASGPEEWSTVVDA